ncbi:unnamed protein product [Linum tenue]|uniref:Uncharacterized protein n=1 Tax=Linum tenue TaxID=586396 RepID=A0AAV0KCQ7_9ROSI|nr:unnamed protein product [Linum tenue]
MDSFGDDEFPELTYCDSCRKMAKTEMKEEYDDDDYIYEDDDFGGDDTLKLRMIHYRRNLTLNGCFYADCPPPQYYMYASTQPHSGYHFKYQQGFDDTVQDCAEFAVETFNDELELMKIRRTFMIYGFFSCVFFRALRWSFVRLRMSLLEVLVTGKSI